jgi:hypothetical protein
VIRAGSWFQWYQESKVVTYLWKCLCSHRLEHNCFHLSG